MAIHDSSDISETGSSRLPDESEYFRPLSDSMMPSHEFEKEISVLCQDERFLAAILASIEGYGDIGTISERAFQDTGGNIPKKYNVSDWQMIIAEIRMRIREGQIICSPNLRQTYASFFRQPG